MCRTASVEKVSSGTLKGLFHLVLPPSPSSTITCNAEISSTAAGASTVAMGHSTQPFRPASDEAVNSCQGESLWPGFDLLCLQSVLLSLPSLPVPHSESSFR